MIESLNIEMKSLREVEQIEATPLAERNLPSSTYAAIQETAAERGDDYALTFLLQGQVDEEPIRYTYAELFEKVTQTANALHSMGVSKDDTVSVLLPNLPQNHFTIWGSEAAGIFNPINPLLDVEHIIALMRETGTKVLVTLAPFPGTDLWDKAQQIIDGLPDLEHVLAVDLANFLPEEFREAFVGEREEYLNDKIKDFDAAIAAQPGDTLISGRVIAPDDIASYFHTGGTTGTPKLAPHTHFNEVACSWQTAILSNREEPAVALCGLPLFHVNGVFVTGLATILGGGEILLASPQGYRNPNVIKDFWALVEKYKVSYFSAVPTILSGLLTVPTDGRDLSSLEFCLCGAAPLATELMTQFEKVTGLKVIEGYGQTEGTCVSTCNPMFGERKVGSVGIRVPYMQVRVVEVDQDGRAIRDCDVNEAGEITISGPTVFNGYKNPDQNKGQWVDDGWFNTGDLGRLDEDGYLWLTGRSKDLIIRGGHNIDPQAIEEPLYKHPAVAEAAAVGKPDERVGELPVVYVQLKPDAQATPEELLNFCVDNIAERAAVPKEVIIIDAIPVTAVGKIFKPTLRNDITSRLVNDILSNALEGESFSVDVEASKKYGQIVKVTSPALNADRLKELLGGFAFKSELG
ncbi:acyl-CoA synthetase [Maricurvus nonylphenolicus]|uniref:acyl-CoA synthetase n=1 Tax=Maricurvus nonylphenolicus TaxID=1008307 RepID=UPI0036F4153C